MANGLVHNVGDHLLGVTQDPTERILKAVYKGPVAAWITMRGLNCFKRAEVLAGCEHMSEDALDAVDRNTFPWRARVLDNYGFMLCEIAEVIQWRTRFTKKGNNETSLRRSVGVQ